MGLNNAKRAMARVVKLAMERMSISVRKRREIRKFKDPRRVAIHSAVTLTPEQTAAIDKLYLENYGEKIPYTWHKHFMAYTGRFDPMYFPELMFIPEFERYMNCRKAYATVFQDKSVLPLIASAVGVRTPQIYFSCVNGVYRDGTQRFITPAEAEEILNGLPEAFAKPTVDSNSGRGCMRIVMRDGKDEKTGLSASEIFRQLGLNFIVQKVVRCHESIRALYAGSVNTFRIITYIWKGEVVHMPVIMRIGQGGSYLDNAHAGGMFIAVSDEGVLHEKAFTEFRKEFTRHPDTGVAFDGHRIANMADVIDAAKRMHQTIAQIGVINWDFTVDEDGAPLLIEANTRGGAIWVIEMAHGCGGFGERTPEVLRWLKHCKPLSPDEIAACMYGNIPGGQDE